MVTEREVIKKLEIYKREKKKYTINRNEDKKRKIKRKEKLKRLMHKNIKNGRGGGGEGYWTLAIKGNNLN